MSLTRDIVAEMAEKYGDAWAAQDSELLLSIFTEDAMYIERPNRTHEGHEQIKEMWENVIVGKQADVCFKHIVEDMIFDEAAMSAVVKWEASFHQVNPDGTPKREHPFRAVWMVTLRFRECEDGCFRVCWFEEFWHPIKTEAEKAAKGKGKAAKGKGKAAKGKGKGKGKSNMGKVKTIVAKPQGVVIKAKDTGIGGKFAAASARVATWSGKQQVKKPTMFVKR